MKRPTVNDFFTDWSGGTPQQPMGIIGFLGGTGNVPWDVNVGDKMDFVYHPLHGKKLASSFLTAVFEESLSVGARASIALRLSYMFGDDWQRLWDALQLPYTATHNYDITEVKNETHDFEVTGTGGHTQKIDETHSQTINGSDTHSGDDVNVRKGTDTTSGSSSVNLTGGETHSGTDTTTYGQQHVITIVSDSPGIIKTISENSKESPNISVNTIPGAEETIITTHPIRNTSVEETYPESGLTVSTIDSGKEVVSEKGGTQNYTWGLDSASPVPESMSLARGGQGSGGGGDGTSEGDGHVTSTEYVDRQNTSTTTGSKNTTETETFIGEGKVVRSYTGSDTEVTSGETSVTRTTSESYEGQDKTITDVDTDEYDVSQSYGHKVDTTKNESGSSSSETSVDRTDTLTHGLKINRENDLSGTDTEDTTFSSNSNDKGSEKTNRNFTRKGNIGGITTQTLLRQEYELRMKHFFDQVFRDIDNIISLPIYC